MIIRLASATDTERFGEIIGRSLRNGDVLSLDGELGAGKTTMTRGIARGMGIKTPVSSPTFTLLMEHDAADGCLTLYHADAYRLEKDTDWYDQGFAEYAEQPDSALIVEWGERVAAALPPTTIRLCLTYDAEEENARTLVFCGSAEQADRFRTWKTQFREEVSDDHFGE